MNTAVQAGLIGESELMALTQFERRGDLERWLRKSEIPYFRGRAGALFTTIRLLESTKLPQSVGGQSPEAEHVEF